jgi:hypothetical protein
MSGEPRPSEPERLTVWIVPGDETTEREARRALKRVWLDQLRRERPDLDWQIVDREDPPEVSPRQ